MDIAEIDKNLRVCCELPEDVEWHDIRKEDAFTLFGLLDCGDDGYRRMPDELTKGISEALYHCSCNTAGGRLRFKTDSPYVAIKASFLSYSLMSHMAFINTAGFDLYVNTETGSFYRSTCMPPTNMSGSPASYANVMWAGNGLKDLTLNFPSYGSPLTVQIGLKKGCQLEKTDGYRDIAPILFYGSSITQGGCASRPGLIYENYISRRFNVDYINLGFSGNGKAEPEVVEYMSGLDFSVFVSDYDHNAPSYEHLENTHYAMYELIRKKHPNVPYIMISKPDIDNNSSGERTREIIYDSYKKARANGDFDVYYIDGKRVFAGADRDCCTVDGCHPNDLGMWRFADTLIGELIKIL